MLQKSKVAEPRIFRENTKQERVADSYTLNRIIEVACEFKRDDEAPHIFIRKTRLQPADFLNISAKRL